MNKYITLFIVLLFCIVIAVVIAGYRKKEEKLEEVAQDPILKFPAKLGSKGSHIRIIQQWLNQQLSAPMDQLDIDGIWGDKTEEAVQYITNQEPGLITYPDYNNMKK